MPRLVAELRFSQALASVLGSRHTEGPFDHAASGYEVSLKQENRSHPHQIIEVTDAQHLQGAPLNLFSYRGPSLHAMFKRDPQRQRVRREETIKLGA